MELKYAGFWRRFAAMIIDWMIVLIPAAIMGIILPYVGSLIVVFVYHAFYDSSEAMTTPGKGFMELIVTNESGSRLTFKQAMIRHLTSYASSLFLCIGYFFNLFTPKRQTFHDIMAGAIVIEQVVPASTDWLGVWYAQFKTVFNLQLDAQMTQANESSKQTSESLAALEQLHKLYTQGALTEQEYQVKKEELLKKI